MERYYRFSGVEIALDIPQELMYEREGHLAPFRVDSVSDPHRFRFALVDALSEPRSGCVSVQPGFRIYREGEWTLRYLGSVKDSWDQAYVRAAHRGKEHEIQLLGSRFPDRLWAKTVLSCLEAEHLVTEAGGFVFHCSCVCVKDKAILFTAPSGVGKSTQAELWRSLREGRIINGDRGVIRCLEDGIYASGLPFAGSSEYCLNAQLPLAAVVYLGQAPVTTIRRLRGYEAFARIWEGCSVNLWDPEDMHRVSAMVEQVASGVPVFHLNCTPDESAVEALENALWKEKTV